MLCFVESIASLILRVTIILCTTREENLLPIIIVKFIDCKMHPNFTDVKLEEAATGY